MLRELIAWVLNTYLGKYVGNLNTAQLTVALLSGQVELENLPLRRDALRNLGLPLQALSGSIGKIKLQVPVRQFRTAPWCIAIEKVYVVIGPINLDEWDAEIEEQADLDYKVACLDRLEAKWRAQREASIEAGYYASSYTGWMNFGSSIVTNIVENLQLKIKDVHIRYEDSISIPNHRFACGLTIDSLSAQSCDANWQTGYTNNWAQNEASFKLVELNSLSFYWDPLTNSETFGETQSSELAGAFQRAKQSWTHKYIMSPVSAEAHLKKDRSEVPLRTRSRPRLVCQLTLNEVTLSLNDWQYNQMVECVRGLDDIAKYRRYRLLRPHHPVSTGPRDWWLYAVRCHGLLRRKRSTDVTAAKDTLRYIALLTRLMLNPIETLTLEQKELKERVERERSFDELKMLREMCMERIPMPDLGSSGGSGGGGGVSSGVGNSVSSGVGAGVDAGPNQGRSMLLHWFPQWWGWYNPQTSTSPNGTASPGEQQQLLAISDGAERSGAQRNFDDDIFDAITDSVENNTLLKRDAVFGKFEFILKKGSLDVCSRTSATESVTMFQLLFENVALKVETRPRSGSHFVGLSLGSVLLKDRLTTNSEFPDLIRPQVKKEQQSVLRSRVQSQRSRGPGTTPTTANTEPFFQLEYERKPLSYNTDYRLFIKSQSLDVVYNTDAIKWFSDFLSKPHQMMARRKIEAMKLRTKKELIKNWESMLDGDLSQRQSWTLEIDISAPQIIIVENLANKHCAIVVVDFGRLQLSNGNLQSAQRTLTSDPASADGIHRDSEDEEAFMTPCSTPPGSNCSRTESLTLCSAMSDLPDLLNNVGSPLDADVLHDKLYDKYNIDLTDLQVLVCKGKERWSFASAKGTSSLHVLDRFSISLQVERRVVYTLDPQYPSLTMSGTLPKLVAHLNENKIAAITTMLNIISSSSTQSPQKTASATHDETSSSPTPSPSTAADTDDDDPAATDDTMSRDDSEQQQREASKLVILQFSIDTMALEVQSRGRSIAELQVTGVKAGFSRRSADTSVSLSVHGLLLVDAIQSFGPDFELLIASHKHVGMDSVSGSLKHSEPCSPCSPGSPDPAQELRRPTSPLAISRAISTLQRDALIVVEILFVAPASDGESLKVANIQFNNLDIIANQETIVELIGFAKRVMPKKLRTFSRGRPEQAEKTPAANVELPQQQQQPPPPLIRTEITFDFHRLNVLILRAIMRDSYLVGRKVGTLTMSEARIHATMGQTIVVEGSLGGLQVLDLTPEGVSHQRILSVGKDPLTEPPNLKQDLLSSLTQEIYAMGQQQQQQHHQHAHNDDSVTEERQALSFTVSRNLNACVDIRIRMASVWYTHCARFMQELNWCASEFKHYLKNLARSIREKATDMALGLVQPRSDMAGTPRATDPGSPKHFPSPRHRTISTSVTTSTQPIKIRLDIVLDTPVLVVPRSSCSPQVFVAHLGKISVSNYTAPTVHQERSSPPAPPIFTITEDQDTVDCVPSSSTVNKADRRLMFDNGSGSMDDDNLDVYSIDVRNMNLFSLDTSNRKGFRLSALPRAEEFYSCREDAVAVLYDTAIRLEITRTIDNPLEMLPELHVDSKDVLLISGSVVKPLQLSLTRQQYEQLLDTFENIFKVPSDLIRPPSEVSVKMHDDDDFVQAFQLNEKFKKRLFHQPSLSEQKTELDLKVGFELPIFIIQLKNEQFEPLIEISFREFNVNYDRTNWYETNVQVSLRSLLMEDLLRPPESKHRIMVISSSPANEDMRSAGGSFSSRSCPNLSGRPSVVRGERDADASGSLPDHLETASTDYFAAHKRMPICPETPPPSPQPRTRQDNLVIYTALLIDPECPTFESQYNNLRQASAIDFNCLDLAVSVQSWFVLLNFFGLLSSDDETDALNRSNGATTKIADTEQDLKTGNTELEISVRSLTLVLVKSDYELAKANVSNAHFVVSKREQAKSVEGRLGSISLYDLTTHGTIYRERFLTSGTEALSFHYMRDAPHTNKHCLDQDAKLKIQMSSVRYVHTKRFVAEIQTFFQEFSQLQTPMLWKIKPSESRNNLEQQHPLQLGLEISAGSPIIVLPVSSRSDLVLVADLGELYLTNSFHMASEVGMISRRAHDDGPDEILDVMLVDLVNTDLFTGARCSITELDNKAIANLCLSMESYAILKKSPGLLKSKCHLKLKVERNMDAWRSHNVPDFSVHGTLSRLEAILDLQQYKLVRGFLAHNLGEAIDEVYLHNSNGHISDSHANLLICDGRSENNRYVWTNNSIILDLQDVSIRLDLPQTNFVGNTSLACINFIKSSLKIDAFSDGSQDIDLVSQEISITDSRNLDASSSRNNVFVNILLPIHRTTADANAVQAEVHSRKRADSHKFTILLNNMRVMAILDWLENVQDFLSQSEDPPPVELTVVQQRITDREATTVVESCPIELNLNITDSELVFVEKIDQYDTNAIILKSTTVVLFRPQEAAKLMSINVNHLEVFSCTLGSEEQTALSIIDPVTVQVDMKRHVLDIQIQKQLSIRLSYHDVKMFHQMLQSVPKQTRHAITAKDDGANVDLARLHAAATTLVALGFARQDCLRALELSANQLDEAALWLTQNAEPLRYGADSTHGSGSGLFDIETFKLHATRISICVIDDCKDADVPLLEVGLSQLELKQELGRGAVEERALAAVATQTPPVGFRQGCLNGVFASDYFNRALSGWEPLIEPWRCSANWNYSFGQAAAKRNRLQVRIDSDDMLRVNVTSTIIELYHLVRENWTQDYYGPTVHRQRTPFVPFALKNNTGLRLWFTTLIALPGGGARLDQLTSSPDTWQLVEPGAMATFSFGPQNKLRHHDSHKPNLHQVGIRVDGWQAVGPVSVDRVGVYFRHARVDVAMGASELMTMPRARIVFAVTQEGSAQKLITVRSALRFFNKLEQPMVLNMKHMYYYLNIRRWPEPIDAIVEPQSCYSVPLSHVHACVYVRPHRLIDYTTNLSAVRSLSKFNGTDCWTTCSDPMSSGSLSERNVYKYCERGIQWKDALEGPELVQELRTCASHVEKYFRIVVSIKREPYPTKEGYLLPGHSIVLLPPVRLHNLLPCDLLYRLASDTVGRIASSETANIHEIDLEQNLELFVTLDSYPGAGQIAVPGNYLGALEIPLRIFDVQQRPLNLRASISVCRGSGMEITVSAPYWLVNRTGLPLVFRQEGVNSDSAGQFAENEEARLVSPLMFSFADGDASHALIVRLGKKRFGNKSLWCQPFNLHKEILHRQLQAGSSNETFVIGIEVRRGRGRYSKTSVVTFSPRFQLYNRSSFKLQFAQKCYATTFSDPLARASFIEAVSGCHLPFHWPRLDRDQQLCVRLPDVAECLWSGGVPIYETQSLYINIRNNSGDMNFLRLEIVLQGATYFLLFGDAHALPPPIRIDNYSEVPIRFYQPVSRHQWRTTVRPHSSLAYALDEPMNAHTLQIEAPGDVSHAYSLRELGMSHNLTYENFIYITFSGTFQRTPIGELDIKSQELVLTVKNGRVLLARKLPGDRAQLWRMNKEKQLEHEGSTPPTEPGKKLTTTTRYVLDLESPPNSTQAELQLIVHSTSTLRRTTQTWQFTAEGRLVCNVPRMCVQASGGIFGLRAGAEVVLGMIVSDKYAATESVVPVEQAIAREKLRAGSGCLSVTVSMDGPIKTIQVRDIQMLDNTQLAVDPAWKHVSHILPHSTVAAAGRQGARASGVSEYHLNLRLSRGVGISIVSKCPCEELAFVALENITLEAIVTPSIRSLDMSVGDMQIDNQLFETPCPVMLYTIRAQPSDSPTRGRLSALQLNVKMLPSPNENAIIFEHCTLSLRPMSLYLEERLLLRFFDFIGIGNSEPDPSALPDESDYEAQRLASQILAANAKRYYFGDLQIVPSQIRLSVITASKLSSRLAAVKKGLGLTLIKFEDAVIEFEKFTDKHHFDTSEVYLSAIKSHYTRELKWQAGSILGSVDFLGNPLGLANDFSEGVSGLLLEGSIKSLVKNVTHGLSNSTAKLTETISDGLGRVVLDEQDTETRQKILEMPSGTNSTGDHLVAGLKGFGFGLLGGMTSIVRHTYAGASADGIQGFISGFGKGLVGTVTKPVIGVLDLASETANAVRETSKTSSRMLPDRKRLPRCVTGAAGGLLPPYSFTQSKGQQHLFVINKRDFGEQFMAYESNLFEGKDSKLRLLVSSQMIRVFSWTEETTTIILAHHLSELVSCVMVAVNGTPKRTKYYIELCLSTASKSMPTPGQEIVRRPRVRCHSEEVAQTASRHINFAKGIFDEREQTLNSESVID